MICQSRWRLLNGSHRVAKRAGQEAVSAQSRGLSPSPCPYAHVLRDGTSRSCCCRAVRICAQIKLITRTYRGSFQLEGRVRCWRNKTRSSLRVPELRVMKLFNTVSSALRPASTVIWDKGRWKKRKQEKKKKKVRAKYAFPRAITPALRRSECGQKRATKCWC